jgi:hypothetical protein
MQHGSLVPKFKFVMLLAWRQSRETGVLMSPAGPALARASSSLSYPAHTRNNKVQNMKFEIDIRLKERLEMKCKFVPPINASVTVPPGESNRY